MNLQPLIQQPRVKLRCSSLELFPFTLSSPYILHKHLRIHTYGRLLHVLLFIFYERLHSFCQWICLVQFTPMNKKQIRNRIQ
jgi:hypothetical protein